MRPEGRDPAYLWDMLENARLAVSFTKSLSFQAFEANREKQLAVERALEIVGEAARRISDSFRASSPEIPWNRIIAHRNVLAHEYDEIRLEIIWKTVHEHVPSLIASLEHCIPPSPQQEDNTLE